MTSKPPVSTRAYVGSGTTRERNARGDGINVYRMPRFDRRGAGGGRPQPAVTTGQTSRAPR